MTLQQQEKLEFLAAMQSRQDYTSVVDLVMLSEKSSTSGV
jgi:hypothetical protein